MIRKIFLLYLFSVILFVCPQANYCIEDRVIAVVNDEVITKEELNSYIMLLKLQIGLEGWDEFQMTQRKALDSLIEDRLVAQEAKNKKIEIEERLIDSRIEKMKSGFENEEEFFSELFKQGITQSELRKRIKDQMLSDRFITLYVRNRIFVSPKEVTEYYQSHTDEFYLSERILTESIFVSDKELSDDIYTELNNGVDFTQLQEKYSQKNSLGLVKRGELRKELEDIIFNLEQGQYSRPIEIEREGYYIFKIQNRYPRECNKLIEVQDAISKIVAQKKFDMKLKALLDDLRKKSYIDIKDE